MGFWSQVLGADNYAAAYNAVLMEHALSVLSTEDFIALMERFPNVVASIMPGIHWGPAFALEIARTGRLVELNLLALTMAHLGQVPRLPKELWMAVQHPFACAADLDANWVKVRRIEADMLAKHGVRIHVPHHSFLLQQFDAIPDSEEGASAQKNQEPPDIPDVLPHDPFAHLHEVVERRRTLGLSNRIHCLTPFLTPLSGSTSESTHDRAGTQIARDLDPSRKPDPLDFSTQLEAIQREFDSGAIDYVERVTRRYQVHLARTIANMPFKDFGQMHAENHQRFDEGDIDFSDYVSVFRALMLAEVGLLLNRTTSED